MSRRSFNPSSFISTASITLFLLGLIIIPIGAFDITAHTTKVISSDSTWSIGINEYFSFVTLTFSLLLLIFAPTKIATVSKFLFAAVKDAITKGKAGAPMAAIIICALILAILIALFMLTLQIIWIITIIVAFAKKAIAEGIFLLIFDAIFILNFILVFTLHLFGSKGALVMNKIAAAKVYIPLIYALMVEILLANITAIISRATLKSPTKAKIQEQ
ncbi:hypothetical protein [Metamycoplasma equirhinis]|uniref:hypothetical protein n=1 Tax=Metamycoplasma equirhinis TaxID=92402 RepID=UPI0035942E6E